MSSEAKAQQAQFGMIGLAVMALTVYTATLARRAEYGVLKALGARNAHLYRVVLGQAFISVALGLAMGFAFTLLLIAIVPLTGLPVAMEISGQSLVKVSGARSSTSTMPFTPPRTAK